MANVIELDGRRCKSLTLCVAEGGPWLADVELAESATVSGPLALVIAGVTLRGAVDDANSGAYLVKAHVRLIGGGAGWRKVLPPRPFHNDANVSIAQVLKATAASAGETLGDLPSGRLDGVDFVRNAGRASRVLDQLAPDWFVDFDGVTQLTARAASEPADGVELKDFQPQNAHAILQVDSPLDVAVGAVLTAERFRLSRDMTVRAFDLVASDVLRCYAWLV